MGHISRRLLVAGPLAALVAASLLAPSPAAASTSAGPWQPTVSQLHGRTVIERDLPRASGQGALAPRPLKVRDEAAYAAAKSATTGRPAAGPQSASNIATGPSVSTFSASFPGISAASQQPSISAYVEPPDTQMAAGPNAIFEMVNVTGQVYTKAGAPSGALISLAQFFGLPTGYIPTDPRILYDSGAGRWYASLLGFNTTTNASQVVLAVSNTSDPTGAWTTYVAYQTAAGAGLCDQPKIGYSALHIDIGCSVFASPAQNAAYVGAVIVVISKTQILANAASVNRAVFGPNPQLFGLVPAQILSSGYNNSYVIENLETAFGFITVSGDPAVDPLQVQLSYQTVAMATTAPPPNARQAGTTRLINTGDDRFMSAVVQNNKLWTTTTVACTPDGDTSQRSCIRLIELQLSPMVMLQDFTSGRAGEDIYYPTLALDSSDDAVLDVSRSSSSEYASHGVFLELSGTTSLTDAGVADAGTGPYAGGRWGDYGAAATDPSTPNAIWFAGEYSATGPGGSPNPLWGTGIGQLTFGTLSLSQTGIGYGAQGVGTTSATQGVTVTNTGAGNLNVSSALDSGSFDQFHVVDNSCASTTLASMATCTAHFTFTPTSVGDKQARFDVIGGFSPLDVVLTGTGVADVCASTAITTDLTSPQAVGAHVTLSATAAGCPHPSPLFRFWIRDTSAVWHIVQDFGTGTSFAWDTSTYPPGTYLTGVWVKDASSSTTYDAYAFGTFTLGLPNCSSTNLSSDIASPQAVGVTVHFTATSIGCPSPLYQWWVRDTAGSWSIKVPFASGNTFAWDTSSLTEGTYQVGIWAKQQFSANSYDAFAFVTYTLTVSHCGSVNLAVSPGSPQAAGATVTLTPTAAGCPGPQYRFYVRDLSATWHVVQDFGLGTTYSWQPSSTVSTNNPGTYLVGVWARQPGSTNTYDAFAFLTFSLTSGTTCTVNVSPSVASPQAASTPVTWTAIPTNCNSTPLQYQFWVNPPGGTWAIAQPYGAGTTFNWTGAGAGTYQVGVWVKQNGSSASYDNFAFTTFTLTTSPPQLCGSVSLSPNPTSPQPTGTQAVVFTATVSGCNSPQFQWWMRDTSANWILLSDYAHSASTFAWDTRMLPAGTYLVGVWARQNGSIASYESYSFLTFTLTAPPVQQCSSTSISPSVASPQPAGTNVTFTAAAIGCNTPDFQFFVAPPGGAFGVVQAFSSTTTLSWNTGALAPGPYQVGVWARQHGSATSYEAFAFITFQLVPPFTPCSTLILTASPGQLIHGGAITISAFASGCSSPRYQFFLRTPGGAYVLVQPYSTTATFSYPPPPPPGPTPVYTPGMYSVLVMARDANSGASYDSFAVTDFLFDP